MNPLVDVLREVSLLLLFTQPLQQVVGIAVIVTILP